MAGFFIYDIIFFAIFTLFVVWFLYTRRKNLQREGILYMYRTKLGIKFINYVGTKFKKTINILQYLSVVVGYILMGGIISLLSFTIYTYIKFPQITQVIRTPPILPLIPYLTSIPGIKEVIPIPLYFTYWIIAILIVAVVHEFAHGIFAKYHGLKIKSTGFVFLGPILGAFVEPDEEAMKKKPTFSQISILSSGVFANIIIAFVFFLILWVMFGLSFQAGGVIIQDYAGEPVMLDQIKTVNGILFDGNFEDLLNKELIEITSSDTKYVMPKEILEKQLEIIKDNPNAVPFMYYDAPAIRNNLSGIIIQINDDKILTIENLTNSLAKYAPGDKIIIKTKINDKIISKEITLEKNPKEDNKPFLGIAINTKSNSGVRGILRNLFFFQDPSTHYTASNDLLAFIYYLFWWIVLINFFVALFNMLPVGILDGGRFFFLTILSITRSEKIAKVSYKILIYIILLIFLLLIFSYIAAL